ncbi:MAG: T9SS type A sorting domain-containing protein [Candidatus Latescibacteria bacterium]|nr:T9SS type A sorting domain-containing protein [Candidatus Latescibacterota bacterium]
MKKFFVITLSVCLFAMLAGNVSARDISREDKQITRDTRGIRTLVDTSVPGAYQAIAQPDTYNIIKYDFEVNDWQGWIKEDYTAQVDIWFHATNFDGDPDPSGGRFFPIEGSWSMWCGAPVGDDNYLCGWLAGPGYGNNWDQSLVSEELTLTESVAIDFTMVHHVEGYGYDEVYLEYENDDGDWVVAQTYGSGSADTVYFDDMVVDTSTITDGTTKIRFHVVSDGAWSDEDGLLNTDGACIVDSITLYVDGSEYDFEDFETATQGDHVVGSWTAEAFAGYVTDHPEYNGPALRTGMTEADPCTDNFGTQVEFFEGNTELADQSIYSGLYVTPRCLNGNGTEAPCQADGIISPSIDMTKYSTNFDDVQDGTIPSGELAGLGGVLFRFEVYRDLPLDNLVFYTWSVRNVIEGCPQAWQDRGYVYYGPDQDYLFTGDNVSDLVVHPDSTLQLTFGVQDMCAIWGGVYGTCTNHSPTPWIDDVRVQRFKTSGPQWTLRGLDIFEDTFPYQSATEQDTCRADAANDITATDNTTEIVRGDSAVIEVTSPIAGGLGTDPTYGGAAVYIHVKAEDPQDGTSLAGTQLVGANDTWMKYISDDGTWTKMRGDTARLGEPGSRGIAIDNYMFDLNDSLFTKGYIVEYYFSAVDANGASGTLPTNADEGGAYEFMCLPLDDEVDVLFVDDFDGRGSWDGLVQDYWDPTFEAVMNTEPPERYDVQAPSSNVGNGLESCIDAKDLGLYYHTIIWDSGDLSTGTIGTNGAEETNDVQLLEDWFTDVQNHNHKVNLLVMGERLMTDLTLQGATSFQTNVLGCELDRGNYYDCTGGFLGGGVIYPKMVAVSGGAFDGLENFCVDGGCPAIQRFDMLSLLGTTSAYALEYEEDCEGETKYAAVANDDTTNNGETARAVTCAFSMMQIRDCDGDGALVRNEFFKKVWDFFLNGSLLDITDDTPTAKFVNKLNQNHPNPFNPSTEIKFSLKKRSNVTIRVYDVSGRLVNTLVDGVLDAGPQSVNWNGINSNGASVASGVYFYRMDTKDYTESKKMILLR